MQYPDNGLVTKGSWNKGKLTGQKPPFKLQEVWAIRIRLELSKRTRDLAMFNLAIDSKLRGCDLVCLKVYDVTNGNTVVSRAKIMQKKTKRPVQFEITKMTRKAISDWMKKARLGPDDFLFPSRMSQSDHISTRQYARLVSSRAEEIGLDHCAYGTDSLRRTKATLIYRKTKNLRVIQLLLGHAKLESTVRYLGIEVDDALAIAEQTEV